MSGIGEHLYREMLAAMDHKPIRDSITRQSAIVRQWVEDSIKSAGVDVTASMIEDIIEMNSIYEGTKPIFNQLVDFAIELDSNGIERGSAKFHAQVRGSAAHGSMDGFYIKEGEIIPYDNPDREPKFINQAEDMKPEVHPLRASWDSAAERYREAEASGDQFGMDSAERMLERLRQQIAAAPLAGAKKPEIKPEVPAAPKSDIDRMDDLDKRIDALPDSGVYSTEQQAELDSIESELDDLDTADGIYFADEDYTDEEYA